MPRRGATRTAVELGGIVAAVVALLFGVERFSAAAAWGLASLLLAACAVALLVRR